MTYSQFVRSTGSNLGFQVALELKGSLVGLMGFPGGSVVKNPPTNTGDTGVAVSIPRSGRSTGGRNGNALQYSCLENPINRGAWLATVHRVAKSQTQASN